MKTFVRSWNIIITSEDYCKQVAELSPSLSLSLSPGEGGVCCALYPLLVGILSGLHYVPQDVSDPSTPTILYP